jgi:hypothetical protein
LNLLKNFLAEKFFEKSDRVPAARKAGRVHKSAKNASVRAAKERKFPMRAARIRLGDWQRAIP